MLRMVQAYLAQHKRLDDEGLQGYKTTLMLLEDVFFLFLSFIVTDHMSIPSLNEVHLSFCVQRDCFL